MYHYIILIALIYLPVNSMAASQILGIVYDSQTGQRIYEEHHLLTGNTHEVTYQKQGAQPFARKLLQDTGIVSRPNVEFNSTLCNESYGVSLIKKNSKADNLLVRYRNSCDKKQAKRRISVDKPYVIDAGFSPYIASQLRVLAKAPITFYYPLPTRQQAVRLKARSIPCKRISQTYEKLLQSKKIDNSNHTSWQYCVSIKPANWLFAQFFPTTYLAYDQDKLLRFYGGRSNMSNDRNQYKDIAIVYQIKP